MKEFHKSKSFKHLPRKQQLGNIKAAQRCSVKQCMRCGENITWYQSEYKSRNGNTLPINTTNGKLHRCQIKVKIYTKKEIQEYLNENK